jgi:hypothetical protein
MKLKVAFFFLIIISFISCKKETFTVQSQYIRIINSSETKLDSIKLIYNHSYSDIIYDEINFYAPEIFDTTTFISISDFTMRFEIIAYKNDSLYYYNWFSLPGSLLDAMRKENIYAPSGFYTFMFSDIDTVNKALIFSLTEFKQL